MGRLKGCTHWTKKTCRGFRPSREATWLPETDNGLHPLDFKAFTHGYSKMNPEVWGNLPPDLIERIAHFTDIDSRRALGFLPRRLVLPDLDLPFQREEYKGVSRLIKLRNAHLYVCQDETAWQFGTNDFMTSRTYSFQRDDGLVSFYALLKMEHSRHPDFNEDGHGGQVAQRLGKFVSRPSQGSIIAVTCNQNVYGTRPP